MMKKNGSYKLLNFRTNTAYAVRTKKPSDLQDEIEKIAIYKDNDNLFVPNCCKSCPNYEPGKTKFCMCVLPSKENPIT